MQRNSWRVYIADAFGSELFGGNQAGVVLLEETETFPDEIIMQKIAGELKHSETAFVKRVDRDVFRIRYFTPVEEVELCGHATIGAFSVLRQEAIIHDGSYRLLAGSQPQELMVQVDETGVWMDMAPPKEIYTFTREEAAELYGAYGLEENVVQIGETYLAPRIVSTGLSDIILPVCSSEALLRAAQDCTLVEGLSRKYQVVGVHMFCLSKRLGILAECRNFAPLYGILEESATGTANGALTYYLHRYGLTECGATNLFLQGEAMGKPSYVKSRLEHTFVDKTEEVTVKIGGTAVISLKGELRKPVL